MTNITKPTEEPDGSTYPPVWIVYEPDEFTRLMVELGHFPSWPWEAEPTVKDGGPDRGYGARFGMELIRPKR